MNFLETITSILEASQKEPKLAEDTKFLTGTLENLQNTLKEVDQKELPQYIVTLLTRDLSEASQLLENLAQKPRNLWTVIRNILPFSDLSNLKKNNRKLVHLTNIMNLFITRRNKNKRSSLSTLSIDLERHYGANAVKKIKRQQSGGFSDRDVMPGPTVFRKSATSMTIPGRFNSFDSDNLARSKSVAPARMQRRQTGKLAFKLKALFEGNLRKMISQTKTVESVINVYWEDEESDKLEYTFQRVDFDYLPPEECTKLSRAHAKLIVTRSLKKKETMCIENTGIESSVEVKQEDGKIEMEQKANGLSLNGNGQINVKFEEEIISVEENKSENNQRENNGKHIGGEEYEYRYVLKDQSTNGSFYLRGLEDLEGITTTTGDFVPLKNSEVELKHGDIIGLIVLKPEYKQLTFGFQLLTH